MKQYNMQPSGLRIPVDLIDDPKVEEEIREQCWLRVILDGYTAEDDYVDTIIDVAEWDWEDSKARSRAKAIAKYILDARRAQQASFGTVPKTTLTQAFEELNKQGVVAKEKFTCCMTCGTTEIGMDVEDFGLWKGYVFYHNQDAEDLVESGMVYLAYGIFLPHYVSKEEFEAMSDEARDAVYEERTLRLVKETVVPTFEQFGIKVNWDGSLSTRILLEDVDYYVPIA